MSEQYTRTKRYSDYGISKDGEVKNLKTKTVLKPYYCHTEDELKVRIRVTKYRSKSEQVKILLAETFLGEVQEGDDVIYIDGDKDNLHVNNLKIVHKEKGDSE